MPSADPEPNLLLIQARERRESPTQPGEPMSRAELATEVSRILFPDPRQRIASPFNANYVGKLESGTIGRPNRPDYRAALRRVLRASSDEELGFANRKTWIPARQASVEDPVPASAIAAESSMFGAFESIENPSGIIIGKSGDWNSFSLVTSMLAQQRQSVEPIALLRLVEAHRECLSTLFRNAGTDPVRKTIGHMLGEASIVASRLWSAHGNRNMALAHCAYAKQLAERIDDVALGATARIFGSNLHSEASTLIGPDGDVMVGLRLLEEAATVSERLTPAARARIAAEQAQTYASLRLHRPAEEALDRAHEAAGDITSEDRVGLYSDWNRSRVEVYDGTCRLLLGDPEKAVAILEPAIHELATDSQNTNVVMAAQVDLASSYAELGEPEMSCKLLGETYGRLREVGNLRGIMRARRSRDRLAHWEGKQVVQELDVRMKSCLAGRAAG
ncbi:hypothetical protein ACWT_3360 [Actinoplanes sp. SE50]|uniref:hypothetical protein n=1 Tax=unclassified Actinoplanes TaxID=2626549 RepID=UPI00023ED075|nr:MULTISPECIES: hypothetical protein [unclassified Actinoplanes]AEV84383.1 hypothetical protein ACPL_3488 [Actinoplanes sp. SE50/110]ATO82775.1 hypothetical protein ACWT_3360 [Actinoplanes sp. SE50]SLM00183.1 hypothetical protein ACSP50_3415 [Actinoplanes sp. SE50/110]